MNNSIQKLPIDLCNQISAGEVVERPANIVKELVENSIDAGASHISVYLEQGGLQSIIVQDDGIGIAKEDLSLALERYATSKIRLFSDLYTLESFGFRGEALASIASVAKVQILSALRLQDGTYAEGNTICIEYGAFVSEGISSIPYGTKIIIEDLFFNVPVRLKFLSSPLAEQRKCLSIFTKIALANSGISFTLYCGGREYIHFSKEDTLRERLERMWASEIIDELCAVEEQYNDISITGFCSTPKSVQKKSDKILLYVNKRPVQDKIVLKGIREAYRGYVTTKEYPCAVLFIDIPPEDIDVNVHPSKTEIRFRDESTIIKAIIVSLRKNIQNMGISAENILEEIKKHEMPPSSQNYSKEQGVWSFLGKENILPRNSELQKENINAHFLPSFISSPASPFNEVQNKKDENNVKVESDSMHSEEVIEFLHDPGHREYSYPSVNQEVQNSTILVQNKNKAQYYKYITTLYENYLFFLSPKKELLILDQHAAHERVLEHIIERNAKAHAEQLMIPISIRVLPTEWERVDEVWEYLHTMGFLLEKGSQEIRILAIPSGMLASYAHIGVKAILSEKKDSIEDIWHRKACTSAIKSGDILSEEDCYVLLEQWLNTPNNICCPHGRPIVVNLPLEELQKLFKRRT